MSYLAFDVGAKRIGVAISRSGIIAEPLMTLDATVREADFQIRSLIDRESPSVIVIGRPDRFGPRSIMIDEFMDRLSRVISENVKIITVDETLTTKEAERLSRPNTDTDALAAALILEQYLAEHGIMNHES